MRIGIDMRLPSYQMGGISRYALNLLPALAKMDEKNSYLLFQMRRERREFVPSGSRMRRKNVLTPCHHKLEKWSFSAETLPHRLDILHSPDFIPPVRGARRHLITVHDLNFLYFPHFLTAESRRYYNDQIAWAVKRADHISADSEHTRRDLIERLGVPPQKVTTVYLAADPLYRSRPSLEAVTATLAKLEMPRDFILFVGTLEPRKGVITLLKTYHRLREKGLVTTPLVLVGRKGWLWEEIFETIEALNLQNFVRHLAGVSDGRLLHLYHAAALLALPSHYEGFGLPPLEAMHCGCAVVTSDRGSLPEIVGEAGLLLDAEDEDGWVDGLGRVLHNQDLRAKMIAEGYRQAAKFTWQETARKTLAIYQSLKI